MERNEFLNLTCGLSSSLTDAVARRVVSLGSHRVDGNLLTTTLCQAAAPSTWRVTEGPAKMVKVTGFDQPTTTQDALWNYFETRRSGGGEVTDVTFESSDVSVPAAFVTFRNALGMWCTLLLLHFPGMSLGSPFWVCDRVFNSTIEVVTFRLRGWCMLDVFLLPALTGLGHEHQDLLRPCDGMHMCTD